MAYIKLAEELVFCFERLLEVQEIKVTENRLAAREKLIVRISSVLTELRR